MEAAKGTKKKILLQHEKTKAELPKKKLLKSNLPAANLPSRQCFINAIEQGALDRINENNFLIYLKIARLCSMEKNNSEIALNFFYAVDKLKSGSLNNDRQIIKNLKKTNSHFAAFSWEVKEVKKEGKKDQARLRHKI